MNEIPLAEFLNDRTQEQAARQIGVTQSRISQMIRSSSDVYVVVAKDGSVVSAFEKRLIGQRSRCVA
ncbi:hypothetical protein KUW00_15780 [Halomonas sp. DP5N14-9]|uniref:Cro/CI family transcriptional regulator n=1 Tax=unclassified Halomonas TaxID=2609666 RepID=UPI000D3AC13D|nr:MULTISPECIES: Cro/CI family transcriptional regulator [unclassified Halomonas]MBY5942340.1 hypothetical protein [Halomonas sp. DP5N14-9]|tara:strand:+ start:60 stop:260 length:201 start_codon:yes stop_codon:yes gene_type:complete